MLPRLSLARAVGVAALLISAAVGAPAAAFCGFYVAKADGDLFNEASKIVMMRDDNRTVITMVNDYEGEPSEFAMVIPTPTVLRESQIHVTENRIVEHLDAYTAPRLVEYFDRNPCEPEIAATVALERSGGGGQTAVAQERARDLGVTIEAEYTVGEYDILILSAEESDGLLTWLNANGYKTPAGAAAVLGSYIRQDMKFFVAKVNLEAQARLGATFLRPLQVAFESEKFMLPIRLGTVNAKGKQDLLLLTLTRRGRVEVANYRTVKIPSNLDVPLFVQSEFGDFYKAIFSTAVAREGGGVVFTEYAWDMAWCDPCAADPLSAQELRELGVYWVDETPGATRRVTPSGGPQDVFVTRLHMRYDAETFPEDLRLHQTGDRENFQGRYVTRHPYKGVMSCPEGDRYRADLARRFERTAQRTANLTGWSIESVRARMAESGQKADPKDAGPEWWERIWADD